MSTKTHNDVATWLERAQALNNLALLRQDDIDECGYDPPPPFEVEKRKKIIEANDLSGTTPLIDRSLLNDTLFHGENIHVFVIGDDKKRRELTLVIVSPYGIPSPDGTEARVAGDGRLVVDKTPITVPYDVAANVLRFDNAVIPTDDNVNDARVDVIAVRRAVNSLDQESAVFSMSSEEMDLVVLYRSTKDALRNRLLHRQ